MKKSLLAIGLLGGLFGAMAQLTGASVTSGATLFVGEGTLMYNGGGVETRGSGLIDVHGNMMIEGQSGDKLRTLDEGGTNNLTAPASNIVLRMNGADPTTSTYGQLYITGIPQANITGFVTKEYKAIKHGVYQQMALPFYGKTLASLASNLGIPGFSNQRGNPSVMYWDNRNFPQFHNLKNAQSINEQAQRDTDPVQYNGAGRYFIVGTNTWDPSAAVKNIDGVPFSDSTPIQFTLKNAGYTDSGLEENYMGGGALSAYGERIRTYLQDSWDEPNSGFFSGNFGRNIYQFANPFLTNIDLSTIGYDERAGSDDDGNNISNIRGVRYEATGVTLGNNGNNGSTTAKFLTFDQSTGVPVGDNGYIIKPMQSFAVKLNDNSGGTLNFNTLRRFSYDQRALNATGQAVNGIGVNNARMQANAGTIKQLRVIGFDADGKEVARTYFVVGPNAKTGVAQDAFLQVSSFSDDLNTREELPTGGEDTSVQNMYFLYINEANQNDFVGKKVAMYANLNKIKTYRFEVAENAQNLANGQSTFTDGGKSFYVEQTPGNLVQIANNLTVPATAAQGGLYYGTPSTMQLATGEVKENSVSDLYVALNKSSKLYEVVFPQGWKTATVNVFDMAGRKVRSYQNVSALKNHVIDLTTEGAYVVEITSNSGIKAIRKIVK